MKKYWYKVCPRCHQGRLFIMKYRDRSDLLLLCEECEWAYDHPRDATTTENGFLGLDIDSEFADGAEISRARWKEFAHEVTED